MIFWHSLDILGKEGSLDEEKAIMNRILTIIGIYSQPKGMIAMLSLHEQIQAIKAKSAALITTEVVAAMKKAFDELKLSNVLEKALKVGDTAPGFAWLNPEGQLVCSEETLKQGQAVMLPGGRQT